MSQYHQWVRFKNEDWVVVKVCNNLFWMAEKWDEYSIHDSNIEKWGPVIPEPIEIPNG